MQELSIKKAIHLSLFTIVYNLVEGFTSIYFGISDGAVGLAGFGGDSLVEVASATLVLWRFKKETLNTAPSMNREKVATLGIGILFSLLSVITITAAILRLKSGDGPDTTIPGVVISVLSLSFMFYLWQAKKKVALEINSATMMSDARCSLACIKLSLILLGGSLLVGVAPSLWWADAAAALGLGILIGLEGWAIVQGVKNGEFTGGCCN